MITIDILILITWTDFGKIYFKDVQINIALDVDDTDLQKSIVTVAY